MDKQSIEQLIEDYQRFLSTATCPMVVADSKKCGRQISCLTFRDYMGWLEGDKILVCEDHYQEASLRYGRDHVVFLSASEKDPSFDCRLH